MVGSALQKLAREHGMNVSGGVAYGSLMGYATTFSEGSGWKRIDISTQFADPDQRIALQTAVNAVDISREYRVQNLTINHKCINIVFLDNLGTMKKLEAFIAWFYPMLTQYGASGANICPECGGEATAGSWYLVDGVAHCFHESCASHVQEAFAQEHQQRQEEDEGSYVQGFFGALLGAALGAVVWALVLLAGYVASIVGLVIGWLAEKGYKLFHGKQGKGKIAILIVVIILGVLLGTLAADGISLAQMINAGELPGYAYGDIPSMILYLLVADGEYLSATLGNVAMGLIFAALGVFALLRKAGREVSAVKVKKLN